MVAERSVVDIHFKQQEVQAGKGGNSAVLDPESNRISLSSLACRLSCSCSSLHGYKVAAAVPGFTSALQARRSSACGFTNTRAFT